MTGMIDLNFHGLVRVRVIGAADQIYRVERQIGSGGSFPGDPDIVIRFVDRLPKSSTVRYVALNATGCPDDTLLVHPGKHRSRTNVHIPFDRVGKQCEIVCEHGLLQVPFLGPILNLTILAKGAVSLPASAFTYRETGVLVAGESKSGMTETLFAFMANGAAYVGDGRLYLSEDGNHMLGHAGRIRVWNWHLDSLPQCQKVFSKTKRAKLRLLGCVVGALDRLTSGDLRQRPTVVRPLTRLRSLLRRQLYVDVSSRRLFQGKSFRLRGVPEKFLFVASQNPPEVIVRPMDPQEFARRMLFSLQEELTHFTSYYRKFRSAFPEAANEFIENAPEIQGETLKRTLEGKDAYEVLHPNPVRLPSLFEAIVERCFTH